MTMHLADHVDVLPQCRLWLANFDVPSDESIGATACDITKAKLMPQDLLRWQQFRPVVKKRQFLNSRLAIRAVLRREFGNNADNIQFSSDSAGCPVLLSNQNCHVAHISLSHSENTVAVLISDGEYPVGVDIEVSNPIRTEALRFVALHPHEQRWCDLHAGLEAEALTTLWTVKESVWKTIRGEYEVPFSDISVQFERGKPWPTICNSPSELLQFQTQVFVQRQRSVITDARHLSTANVALVGSATQRMAISADVDRSQPEYLRRI
jgi:phosphopantetheinyl transferase